MDRVSRNYYITNFVNLLKNNRKKVAVVALVYALLKINKAVSHRSRNNATSDRYDWTQEVVVITGGSSGIGACLVKRLADRGIKVAILDILPPPTTTPSVLSARVTFHKCDITSREDIARVGQEIRFTLGVPTILINNAGIVRPAASILTKSKSDIDLTLAVNAVSHFFTVQEFLPEMLKRNHGHIITTSSLAAFLCTPNVSDYNMSKAAATAFHETLGLELLHVHGAKKVRTSIIHPGYVKTALHAESAFGTHENPLLKAALGPDDVAREIETVVLGGESRTIAVPRNLGYIGGTRGWPEWMFRGLMDRVSRAALQ